MLRINVGLNKKASKDFQSTGLSINLEAELDSGLLARPVELQAQIDGLYAQAQAALDRQSAQLAASALPQAARNATAPRTSHTVARQAPPTTNRSDTRPTATAGRVDGNAPPLATDSQIKAIRAIAQSVGVDPEAEADVLRFKFPLGRGDASRLIDHLKAMQSPQRAAA